MSGGVLQLPQKDGTTVDLNHEENQHGKDVVLENCPNPVWHRFKTEKPAWQATTCVPAEHLFLSSKLAVDLADLGVGLQQEL